MSIFQLLGDGFAQQLSSASLVPTADATMAPLEALSLHDAGNVVVADGSKSLFSRLFAAFPVAAAITSRLALNDIDALAQISKQTRANLLPFRKFIITSSLFCENDKGGPNILGWYHACARDLVSFCRRAGCSAKFCRNCAHQRGFLHTPSRSGAAAVWELGLRYRRLCKMCQRAPLRKHNHPDYHRSAPPHQHMYCDCGRRSVGCFCDAHSVQVVNTMENSLVRYYELAAFISPLRTIHSNSATPQRKSKVLARYDGFPCARDTNCLAARTETEGVISGPGTEEQITTDTLSSVGHSPGLKATGDTTNAFSSVGLSLGLKAGGDAGAAEKTNTTGSLSSKKHLVAASIDFTNDEVISAHGAPPTLSCFDKYFLCAEKEGRARSLCAWCHRIVPSARDKQKYGFR